MTFKMTDNTKFTLSITETPSKFSNLEKMSVPELISSINREDAKVHRAVKKALPQIEQLVVRIIERMKEGEESFTWVPAPAADWGFSMLLNFPPPLGYLKTW